LPSIPKQSLGPLAGWLARPLACFLFRLRPVFEFKRRNPKVSSDGDVGRPPRFFPDGIAALRYACRFHECPLEEGVFLPAVILDPRELFRTQRPEVSKGLHFLCVASRDGGFVVAAHPMGEKGPRLEPGQLVAWKAVRHVPELAAGIQDERFGWTGVIVGTLKLEHRNGCWVADEIFRPATPARAF
jgi:hypothetical protein